MSAGFIADSSVAIAWVVFSQSRFAVPVLWMFEVANALLALRRRQRIQRDEYNQALIDLGDSRPLVDNEGPVRALDAISKLAESTSYLYTMRCTWS